VNWEALVLLVLSYLLGSIPVAYLFGRWFCGVDIRTIGSGNVGGSNLRALSGVWATVLVGAIDICKGALPVWLGPRLGFGAPAAYAAGLAAVIGHDWSIWLGFQGGRGQACTLGVLLVVFPYGLLWVLALLALGALLGRVASLHALAVLTLPLLAVMTRQAGAIVWLMVALVLLVLVKRLEANKAFRIPLGGGVDRWTVYRNRLLLDRDWK
jgi:acyl phosphate:glycerol-3-phosphate acyltransferase